MSVAIASTLERLGTTRLAKNRRVTRAAEMSGGAARSILLAGRANALHALQNTPVETDDSGGKLIYRRNQRQADGRDDQGVFHQVLALFILQEPKQKISHTIESPLTSLQRPRQPLTIPEQHQRLT